VADVFVSYARENQAVVSQVVSALEARGKTCFVDWAGIEPSDHWRDSIREAIEEADAVVCVLSPDFLASEVCASEREHAERLNKRLVPVVAREVDPGDVPPSLVEPNWILLADDELDRAADELVRALDTDLDLVRLHTRLLSRALAWDAAGRKRTSLLRGQDLRRAEEWLARAAAGARPQPTDLQVDFIEASRRGAAQRQRLAVAGALTVAGVAAGLSVFAFISRAQAVHESQVAFSRELAAASSAKLDHDPQLALLLGTQALERAATPASEAAVVAALDSSFVTRIVRVGAPVLDATYSADGKLAAVGTADGTVRVWNPQTGSTPLILHVGARVTAVAFHPSGTVLVTGSADGRVTVWERTADGWRATRPGYRFDRSAITSLAFSPTGKVLAVGSADHTVRLIPGGEPVRTIPEKASVTSVTFGSNDTTLVTADALDGTVVWDLSHTRPLIRASLIPQVPSQTPRRVAFDTSGSGLIAIACDDGEIRLWDYGSHAVGLLSGHVGPVTDVAFSPDGTLLASAGADGTVRLWDMNSRQLVRVLGGHRQAVDRVVFSPGGAMLLTASQDGTARVWLVSRESTAARSVLFPNLGLSRNLAGVAISNGLLVAAGVDGDAHGWPLANTSHERWTCTIPTCEVRAGSATGISAGGGFVVVPADPTRLFRPSDERVVRKLPAARAAALSHGGRELVLVTRAGVELYDHGPLGPSLALTVPAGLRPRAVAFDPNGGELAAAANAGQVVVWIRAQGWRAHVLRGAVGDLHAVGFTPDGRDVVAGGGDDGNAWLWKLAGGRPQAFVGHTAPVNAVAVSPDGKSLATSSDDSTARLWDIATDSTIRVLTGHTDVVTGVAFTPDGSEVATSGADGTVRLWDGCSYCLSQRLLLARAKRAEVRCLTALEQRVYLHENVTKDEPCAA